ncbi:hypothetical protein EXIGLDRAFT_730030 [Exidia glandulosa HHB12029]|uniref:Uncharacterized protein n=1 Tax=Exidia glandulosa HHB12029 TaxID=1314781 RepID=A0A165CBZ7_EXIGL|nr:hypothetical protein EXIGLDRAFT_730030 [Exidia glandulosa HHB12029]
MSPRAIDLRQLCLVLIDRLRSSKDTACADGSVQTQCNTGFWARTPGAFPLRAAGEEDPARWCRRRRAIGLSCCVARIGTADSDICTTAHRPPPPVDRRQKSQIAACSSWRVMKHRAQDGTTLTHPNTGHI